jgi:hypothetical protein
MCKLKDHLVALAAVPASNVGNKDTSSEIAHKGSNETISQT